MNVLKYFKVTHTKEIITLLTSANKAGFTPLHDALKNGNIENINILLSNMQSIISNKGLLKQQIYKSNKSRYNCLHQIAGSGNIEAIITFIRFIRDNFEHDSVAILNDLMSQENKNGYRPSARGKGKEAVEINKLLSSLKIQDNTPPNLFREKRRSYPRRRHKDQGSSSCYRHGK